MSEPRKKRMPLLRFADLPREKRITDRKLIDRGARWCDGRWDDNPRRCAAASKMDTGVGPSYLAKDEYARCKRKAMFGGEFCGNHRGRA